MAGRRRWPVRVLAGLILVAAVLLLWPFAAWSWWPVVIGLGVLVLLYLLRLDRLLFGWAPHLAGLVVVVLMAARSDAWAWGLAAGLAVLGAGFVRLPAARLLVVGAVLSLVCGAGYGFTHYQSAAQRHANQVAQDHLYVRSRSAVPAGAVVARLSEDIATGQDLQACGLLGPTGGTQFAQAAGAPDCRSAVAALRARVTDPGRYGQPTLPRGSVVHQPDATVTVSGCAASWSGSEPPPGPLLGTFHLTKLTGSDNGYLVDTYTPCP
jgi:hypothetical protein